jgi:uncharacterized coiled-coil DUF342 family protein
MADESTNNHLDDVRELIAALKDKSARLHEAYRNEKRKNYELTKHINEVKEENSELNSNIEKLNEELETIKVSATFNNKERKKEAKDEINTLIREIDNCIALINKM